jgi:hypothetical protein
VGRPTGLKPRPLAERFWEKVDKRGPDECWEWTASRNPDGYGHLRVGSLRDGTRRMRKAPRVAYELTHGPIPPSSASTHGTCVLHSCDNPGCCNPRHLFLGSQYDNIADMQAKGRDKLPPAWSLRDPKTGRFIPRAERNPE